MNHSRDALKNPLYPGHGGLLFAHSGYFSSISKLPLKLRFEFYGRVQGQTEMREREKELRLNRMDV